MRQSIGYFMAGLIATALIALATAQPSAAQRADDAKPLTLVAFGDSLTAGYNLPASAAFPAQLERALADAGIPNVKVLNSGVSGDTTGAGLARFDWAVPENADAIILELGANDALRGVPVEAAKANLVKILDRIEQRGLPVLIAGIPAIANYGDDYREAFDELFGVLAKRYGAILYENFLEGVNGDPALSLPDGLHPNENGVAKIVENIMPSVKKLVARARAEQASR